MGFEEEVKGLGNNLQDFVQGDVEIGGQRIPKIIPVGVVVGIVAFLGYRASKNKTSSSASGVTGGLFGTGGENGGSSNVSNAGGLGTDNSDAILDNVFSDINDKNPFPLSFDDNLGTGFESVLPSTYQLPVTPEYNLPEQVSGYSDYNPNVPYMTSANPVSDANGNLYAVPNNVANKIQKSTSSTKLNTDKNLVNSINAAFGKGSSNSSTVSQLQSVLGKSAASVSGLGTVAKPLTPQQVQVQSKVVVPLQNVFKPVQTAVNSIVGIFNIGNSSNASNKGSVTGLGTSPIAVQSKAPPKPVVASVKPPQVIATKPSVSVSKVVSSPVPAKKPVVTVQPKVGGKPVVLR